MHGTIWAQLSGSRDVGSHAVTIHGFRARRTDRPGNASCLPGWRQVGDGWLGCAMRLQKAMTR